MVFRGHQVLLDILVHRGIRGTKDLLVLQELLALRVLQELLARMGIRVPRESPGQLGHKGQLDLY
jgi:hypothetical protein